MTWRKPINVEGVPIKANCLLCKKYKKCKNRGNEHTICVKFK